MKNLKNFNHWIAELREIAFSKELVSIDDNENIPISKNEVKNLFNKENFKGRFDDGCTPQEAFDLEMDMWQDAAQL